MKDLSVSDRALRREPLVWRRLLVNSETTLAELHYALQIAFDWSDEHLHRFRIHGKDYGISQCGGIVFDEGARRVPLSRLRLHCGERFRYEYDFTADWKVDLRLEKAVPFDPRRPMPLCTAGRRASPPEDCCGARDYLERLDRHRDPFEDLAIMAEALQRLLDSGGDRKPWAISTSFATRSSKWRSIRSSSPRGSSGGK